MTDAERRAVEARCAVMESAPRTESGLFLHQADVQYACEALAACRKALPTDPALAARLNDLTEATRTGLKRTCPLWHAGYVGKGLILAGLAVSAIIASFSPQLAILTLVPMVLFLLFSLTPPAVMLNPNPVDSLTTKTFMACAAIGGGMATVAEASETVYVDRFTKEVVARETNPLAILIGLLGVAIMVVSVVFLFVRVEILFLRNYLVYR